MIPGQATCKKNKRRGFAMHKALTLKPMLFHE